MMAGWVAGRAGTIIPGVLVILLLAASASPAAERRALLVGIDRYEVPAGTADDSRGGRQPNDWYDLRGAGNDVEALRAVLLARFGFAPGEILVLRDSLATRDGILAGIGEHLLDPTQPGDEVLFFYAGHGSQVRNSRSPETDGLDETIVPADANRGAWDIRDKELTRLFNDIIDRGGRLTAIFDCCHSGTITRSGSVPGRRERFLAPDPRDVAEHLPDDPTDPRGYPADRGALVLSASQDFQGAAEALDELGQDRGAFSFALVRVLASLQGHETVEDVFLRVRALLRTIGTVQEPVLDAGTGRRTTPLLGTADTRRRPRTVVAVQEVLSATEVLLQGGFALGIQPGCELRLLTAAENATTTTLTVTDVLDLARCKAAIHDGDVGDLAPGDLLELVTWVAPPGKALSVWVPPTIPPALAVQRELDTLGSQVVLAASPDEAHYLLAAREGPDGPQFAWTRPQDAPTDLDAPALLPRQTAWVTDPDTRSLARQLVDQAHRLAVVLGWLGWESSPASPFFPYRLEIRQVGSDIPLADPVLQEGRRYRFVLHADPEQLERGCVRRWCYLFAIDGRGEVWRLLPAGSANEGNYLPEPTPGRRGYPEDIPVGPELRVTPPYGTDLFVLFTSSESVPVSNLIGQPTRASWERPRNWSVQKLVLTSQPGSGEG